MAEVKEGKVVSGSRILILAAALENTIEALALREITIY